MSLELTPFSLLSHTHCPFCGNQILIQCSTCQSSFFHEKKPIRYGFELGCTTGRSCDIASSSRKFLSFRSGFLLKSVFSILFLFTFTVSQVLKYFTAGFILANYPGRCVFQDILEFARDANQPFSQLKLASGKKKNIMLFWGLMVYVHKLE